jgi:uncharacterized membrane protein SpoIIM required for sporulation
MTVDEFAGRRRPVWYELETALAKAAAGIRGIPSRELERFGVLYRHASGDLAIARRDFPTDNVTVYLNGLCSRAHTLLYVGRGGGSVALRGVAAFYRRGLPRVFRASWRHMLASLALLLVGFTAGWLAVILRPDLAASLVPSSLFDQMARGLHPTQLDDPALAAFGIFTNNIKVALICFAGGLLLGSLTTLILVTNGWMLGTLAAAIHQGGYDVAFWSLILPHGVMELSIIVLAGGSGLMMGTSVLRPGLLSRWDSLHDAAVRAMFLALGVASLLPICGVIEGFISPSGLPVWFKFTVAGVTGTVLYGWLLLGGRADPGAPVARPHELVLGGS